MAPNERQQILIDAANLIVGERNEDYGDPYDDFSMTADLWHAYLMRTRDARKGFVIFPHDVAVMMALLKISRLSWTPQKRDHWLDIAGYVGCGWDCVDRDSPTSHESIEHENETPV